MELTKVFGILKLVIWIIDRITKRKPTYETQTDEQEEFEEFLPEERRDPRSKPD